MSTPAPHVPVEEPHAEALQPLGIELHSIDWVPNDERHGEVRHLGALWFVSNINLTAMATGVAALSLGAGLTWTILATVIGSLFGTFFMAFHSAQGPQLGLPQLVQSRPQFGYVGAAITVWIFALINYVAYNTSDALLSGDAMNTLFGVNTNVGYFLAAAVAAAIALYGYHWIHRVNRWLTWPLLAVMVVLTVAALTDGKLASDAYSPGPFKASAFVTVFVIVAGFQLGWAPYVSDYSRYLPSNVGVRSTFWWTYLRERPVRDLGLRPRLDHVLGGRPRRADPSPPSRAPPTGCSAGSGSSPSSRCCSACCRSWRINQYGGMMSMISIRDSFVPVAPSCRTARSASRSCSSPSGASPSSSASTASTASTATSSIFLAYLFTPWTAINLVDYFFVRRGAT